VARRPGGPAPRRPPRRLAATLAGTDVGLGHAADRRDRRHRLLGKESTTILFTRSGFSWVRKCEVPGTMANPRSAARRTASASPASATALTARQPLESRRRGRVTNHQSPSSRSRRAGPVVLGYRQSGVDQQRGSGKRSPGGCSCRRPATRSWIRSPWPRFIFAGDARSPQDVQSRTGTRDRTGG
jgi:hypothetical protein